MDGGSYHPQNNDPCADGGSSSSYIFWQSIGWYVYTVVQVIYVFGMLGNIVSLLAFKKQLKQTGCGYYHQLSIIISDMVNIICNVVAECGYVYLSVYDPPAAGFIQNAPLFLLFVWAYNFADMAATGSLIIMNGACLDRLYALYKPMKYPHLPQKRMAVALFGFAYSIGILTNLQDCIAKKIVWRDSKDSYVVFYDTEILSMPFVIFLSTFLIIMRGVLLVSLFLLVILVSRKYSSIMKTTIHPTSAQGASRPVSEKTLTKLLMVQSSLTLVGLMSSIVYDVTIMVLRIPWCKPLALIMDQVEASLIAIQQSANYLMYIGISKEFQKAVMAVIQRKELETPATLALHQGTRLHQNVNRKRRISGNTSPRRCPGNERQVHLNNYVQDVETEL